MSSYQTHRPTPARRGRPLVIAAVVAAALAGGWAGASYATQQALVKKIRASLDVKDPTVPYRFRVTEAHAGLRQASGRFELLSHAPCEGVQAADTPVGHVTWQVEQGWNPFGARHVHWQLDVDRPAAGAAPEPVAAVLRSVSGDGTVTRDGSTDQRIVLALDEQVVPKGQVSIDPMDLSVRMNGAGYDGTLSLAAVRLTGPKGEAVALKGLSGRVSSPDGSRYAGTYAFTMQELTGPEVALRGLRLEGASKVERDVWSGRASYRLAGGQAGGKEVKDLVLALSLSGFRIADLNRLGAAADARCHGGTAADAPDLGRVMVAMQQVARQGFVISVDQLGGQVGNGRIEGSTRLEFLATPGTEPISTARAVKASGRLRVTGSDLLPPSIEPLVAQQLVVLEGDGITSSFDLHDGQLVLNGRPMDLPMLPLLQARIDAALSADPARVAGGGAAVPGGAALNAE